LQVAPDRLAHHLDAVDERIVLHRQQGALAVQQAPDERMEQCKPLRIAVAHHVFDQVRDGAWQGHRRRVA
jgi:hypothetical protein